VAGGLWWATPRGREETETMSWQPEIDEGSFRKVGSVAGEAFCDDDGRLVDFSAIKATRLVDLA
jgi:hypothetical protein